MYAGARIHIASLTGHTHTRFSRCCFGTFPHSVAQLFPPQPCPCLDKYTLAEGGVYFTHVVHVPFLHCCSTLLQRIVGNGLRCSSFGSAWAERGHTPYSRGLDYVQYAVEEHKLTCRFFFYMHVMVHVINIHACYRNTLLYYKSPYTAVRMYDACTVLSYKMVNCTIYDNTFLWGHFLHQQRSWAIRSVSWISTQDTVCTSYMPHSVLYPETPL